MSTRRTVEFVVPGQPTAKARPRMVAGRMYTPAKTVNYEGMVAILAAEAMAGRPLFEGACAVDLHIIMSVPPSWPAKKRAEALAGTRYPTTKPDMDNVVKAIYDGMNGVVWRDDVQACDGAQRKRYGAVPGVWVAVAEMGSE